MTSSLPLSSLSQSLSLHRQRHYHLNHNYYLNKSLFSSFILFLFFFQKLQAGFQERRKVFELFIEEGRHVREVVCDEKQREELSEVLTTLTRRWDECSRWAAGRYQLAVLSTYYERSSYDVVTYLDKIQTKMATVDIPPNVKEKIYQDTEKAKVCRCESLFFVIFIIIMSSSSSSHDHHYHYLRHNYHQHNHCHHHHHHHHHNHHHHHHRRHHHHHNHHLHRHHYHTKLMVNQLF